MKIYNEMGRLTDEGKKITKNFTDIVNDLISSGENPNDIRIIGSILSGMVGEIVSEQVAKKK